MTEYMLSAAFPSELKLYSEGFVLTAEYVSFRRPSNGVVDPRPLGDGTFAGVDVVDRRPIPQAPNLTLVTAGPLFEETMGETPIGAWTPAKGAKLIISRQGDSTGQYQFTESFDNLPDPNDQAAVKRFSTDGDVFPIVDLVGPTLVVWTESPTYFFGGGGFKVDAVADGLIHAVIIKVPFALRTGLGGTTARGDKSADVRLHEKVAEYTADGMMIDPLGLGQFRGLLLNLPSRALDYDAVRSVVENDPIINGCGPSNLGSSTMRELCMDFRRPLMPDKNGVNIFGAVDKITFSSAEGSMMIGARHIDMNPAVPVTVLKANAYDNPAGKLTIPIQLSSDRIKVDGQFAANGEVTVNGEPMTRRIEQFSPYFAALSIVLGLCSIGTYLRRPHRQISKVT